MLTGFFVNFEDLPSIEFRHTTNISIEITFLFVMICKCFKNENTQNPVNSSQFHNSEMLKLINATFFRK